MPSPEPLPDPNGTVQCSPPPGPSVTQSLSGPEQSTDSTLPHKPAPAVTEPPTIPGYRITGLIAQGGMGQVYAAFDETLQREVAVKTLLLRADLERFVREAQITARLPHPNIPPVYALGLQPDGTPWLAMKYIRGQTLETLLNGRGGPQNDLPRYLQIFEQITQAVGFAHSRGIIHRDLKPLNVMVGEFGEVQVMDWGLAKDLSQNRQPAIGPTDPQSKCGGRVDDAHHTVAGTILGTPGYMAPEQARGEEVDVRADVFALGSILAAILTDRPAFVGSTVHETIAKTAAADLTDVLSRLDTSQADVGLIALAKRCLAAELQDRPADAREVAAAVAAYRAGVEARLRRAETEAAEALVREAEQRKRRRVVQWAGGLIAAVLVCGILGTTIGLLRASDAAEKERQARLLAQRETRRAEEAAAAEKKANDTTQRRLAQIEKGIELLAGMLTDINPRAEEQGGDPLYVQLRQRAAKVADELDAEAVGDPLAVARLQTILGNTLQELGNAAKAIEVLEKARLTRQRELGADHPDSLDTLNTLAAAYRATGRLPEAIALFEQVRAAATEKLGADHPETLAAVHNLAVAYRDAARLPEAITLLERVRDAVVRKLGADHPDTLTTLHSLAGAYWDAGKLTEAIMLLERARDVVVNKLGTDHPHTLATLNNLAIAYHVTGRLSEALALFEQVRDAKIRKLGADHPETLTTLHNLAIVHREAGRLSEALPLLEQAAHGIVKQHFRHPHAHLIMTDTIQIYEAVNQFNKAETWRREWVNFVKGRDGPESPTYAAELATLGQNLLAQQKWSEAEAVLRECLAIREKKEAEAWTTFDTRLLLGKAMLGQKKYLEAELLLLKGYEGLKARESNIPPQGSICIPDALDRLIELYTATNMPDEVKKYQKLRARYR
jgi:tetratricopeptide (TPR) repeat protein